MAEGGFDEIEMEEKVDNYADAENEEEINSLFKLRNDLTKKLSESDNIFSKVKYVKRIEDINKDVNAIELDRYSYSSLTNYFDEISEYVKKLRGEKGKFINKDDIQRIEIVKEIEKSNATKEKILEELEKRDKIIDYSDAENYSDQRLTDIKNDILIKEKRLRNRYGDNEKTPERVKELYEYYDEETKLIEKEKDRREFNFRDGKDSAEVIISDENDDDITTVPKVAFVESNNEFNKVTDESYNLAFKGTEDIEVRLAILKDYRLRKEAESEIKRVKLLQRKVRTLYKKDITFDSPAAREIVNRSFVTDNDGIRFKPIGTSGELLADRLILKKRGKNLVFSSDIKSKNAIKQIKELVSKLPDTQSDTVKKESDDNSAVEGFKVNTGENSDNYVDIPGLYNP